MLGGALELERQHVQQHFAVGIRVDVTKIELKQLALPVPRCWSDCRCDQSVTPNGELT